MSALGNIAKPFVDVSLSDIIGGYVKVQEIESQSALQQLRIQGENQARLLSSPVVDSAQVAVDTGYANVPSNKTSMLSGLSKNWIFGGIAALFVAGVSMLVLSK